MPFVPKLDHVLELRFYRQSGVGSETIFARRESRVTEHEARGGVPTKLERATFLVERREDIRAGLMEAQTADPVRVYDASVGIEYSIKSADDLPNNRRRMLLRCTAFVPSQR